MSDFDSSLPLYDSDNDSDTAVTEILYYAEENEPTEQFEPHCWFCLNPYVTVKCSDCLRTYHVKCVAENCKTVPFEFTGTITLEDVRMEKTVTFKIGVCPECLLISKSEVWDKETLKNILLPFGRKLQSHFPYYKCLEELSDVVYPMDLNTLVKNVYRMKYSSLEGFHSDAKWLFHNIAVYADSEFDGKPYTHILGGVKYLMKWCRKGIKDIKVCPCFPSWAGLKNACQFPHVLVWVDGRHPTWPAKAYRIFKKSSKKYLVLVKFFGDKMTIKVDLNKCYLYNQQSHVDSKAAVAIKDCEEYKRYMEEEFGRVVLPPKDTKEMLVPDLSQIIKKMFPDVSAVANLLVDYS